MSANGMAFNVSNTYGSRGGRTLFDPYENRPTGRGSADESDTPQGRRTNVDPVILPKQQPWQPRPLNEEQMRNNPQLIPTAQRPEVILRFNDGKNLLLSGLLDKSSSIAERAIVIDAHLGTGNVAPLRQQPCLPRRDHRQLQPRLQRHHELRPPHPNNEVASHRVPHPWLALGHGWDIGTKHEPSSLPVAQTSVILSEATCSPIASGAVEGPRATMHRPRVPNLSAMELPPHHPRITPQIRETSMPLKIILGITGTIFLALAYPMILFIRQEPALSMMLSLYVTLGVFLLLAIRNPSAHRSLIAFTAWSSLAHAALMGTQAMRDMIARGELIGVAVLALIGVLLIALAPAKPLSTIA